MTRPAESVNGYAARRDATETSALVGPTIRRHRLGAELRRLRDASGLRLEDVAARLDVAPSTLSRIETGKAPTRTSYLYTMLDIYGVDDPQQRCHLADLAREGQRKGWWADYDDLLPPGTGSYLGLEAAASKICTFAVQAIPSLLQTAGYAAAVIRAGLSAEQQDRLVAVTMRRQEISPGLRELHAVIDESALLRTFGSADVMAAQLDHLASTTTDPLITVQVLRLTASPQLLSPGFTILSFTDQADPDVGCGNGDEDQVNLTTGSDSVSRLRSTFTKLTQHADTPARSAELIGQLRTEGRRRT
jgi:transcriptional regulator with XRE-family HTH domain